MLSWGMHGPGKPCTYVQTKAGSFCMRVGCAACTATFTRFAMTAYTEAACKAGGPCKWTALQRQQLLGQQSKLHGAGIKVLV